MGERFKKLNSGVNVPVLNVSKWTPKLKKKNMLHIVSPTGGLEKKIKKRPRYYLRGLPVNSNDARDAFYNRGVI